MQIQMKKHAFRPLVYIHVILHYDSLELFLTIHALLAILLFHHFHIHLFYVMNK